MESKLVESVVVLLKEMMGDDYCYVTTIGRTSGEPREIEIWFGVHKSSIYLISGAGEKSNWVKNMRANPNVNVRIRERTFKGLVHFMSAEDEEGMVRTMMAKKYQGWRAGHTFSDWARAGLVVGIELGL